MQVLNDAEVLNKLTWPKTLNALEAAFNKRSKNPSYFQMPARLAISQQENSFLTMPCVDAEGWFGVKQVSVIPDNYLRSKETVQAHYTLFDPTGTAVLSASADSLTKFRTAATSALAAKYLVNKDAQNLLVIGAGALAPFMAEAHCFVHDYQNIMLWGRNFDKAKIVAKDIEKRLLRNIEVVKDLESSLQKADVITVATTAAKAVIKSEFLKEGQHIDLVGAFTPQMQELDERAIKRASVFVDDLAACKTEAGDLIKAKKQGWSFAHVKADLATLLNDGYQTKEKEITVFKSVGLALEDLVVARILLNS